MPLPPSPDDAPLTARQLLVLPDGRVVEDTLEIGGTVTTSTQSQAMAAQSAMAAMAATAGAAEPVEKRRVLLPLVLFLATVASTFLAGTTIRSPGLFLESYQAASQAIAGHWRDGLLYSAAVMGILVTHEMGHFIAATLHRIPASFPYFLPVPFIPFGTMGAVIQMRGSKADRRAMFDLGVAGPIAGLVVAVPVVCLGILRLTPPAQHGYDVGFHNPLLFSLLIDWLRPDLAGQDSIYLTQFNPLILAGWVGLFVTGLNMLPVGQLDGGHVAYALLGPRARLLARALIVAAIAFIVIEDKTMWVIMLTLICLIGPDHPPTANDQARLGPVRLLIGWAAMTIPILCFSPLGVVLVRH